MRVTKQMVGLCAQGQRLSHSKLSTMRNPSQRSSIRMLPSFLAAAAYFPTRQVEATSSDRSTQVSSGTAYPS